MALRPEGRRRFCCDAQGTRELRRHHVLRQARGPRLLARRTAGADREFIEKHYRVLKPCLHGSDAHHDDETGTPEQDRFCWLKGDLHLKRCAKPSSKPGERVWIGAQTPSHAIPALTIQKTAFGTAPWMKKRRRRAQCRPRGDHRRTGLREDGVGRHRCDGRSCEGCGWAKPRFSEARLFSLSISCGAATVDLTGRMERRRPPNASRGGASIQPDPSATSRSTFVEKLCSSAGLATELRSAMERVVFESTDSLCTPRGRHLR